MRPSIRFRCAGCGARIKAPAQLLGQTRPCPGCGHGMVVRPDKPEDSGPRLVVEFNRPDAGGRRRAW